VPVPVADVDQPSRDERRRLARPEVEAPTNGSGPLPVRNDLAVGSGNRRRAGAADVRIDHELLPHDGRSPAAATRVPAPKQTPRKRSESEEAAVPGCQDDP